MMAETMLSIAGIMQIIMLVVTVGLALAAVCLHAHGRHAEAAYFMAFAAMTATAAVG